MTFEILDPSSYRTGSSLSYMGCMEHLRTRDVTSSPYILGITPLRGNLSKCKDMYKHLGFSNFRELAQDYIDILHVVFNVDVKKDGALYILRKHAEIKGGKASGIYIEFDSTHTCFTHKKSQFQLRLLKYAAFCAIRFLGYLPDFSNHTFKHYEKTNDVVQYFRVLFEKFYDVIEDSDKDPFMWYQYLTVYSQNIGNLENKNNFVYPIISLALQPYNVIDGYQYVNNMKYQPSQTVSIRKLIIGQTEVEGKKIRSSGLPLFYSLETFKNTCRLDNSGLPTLNGLFNLQMIGIKHLPKNKEDISDISGMNYYIDHFRHTIEETIETYTGKYLTETEAKSLLYAINTNAKLLSVVDFLKQKKRYNIYTHPSKEIFTSGIGFRWQRILKNPEILLYFAKNTEYLNHFTKTDPGFFKRNFYSEDMAKNEKVLTLIKFSAVLTRRVMVLWNKLLDEEINFICQTVENIEIYEAA